jgi:hypothetical protein
MRPNALMNYLLKYHPVSKAVILTGDHGIGKSQFVKQYADSIGAEMVDIRLGQVETGDIIGLPRESLEKYIDKDGNEQERPVTSYSPPWWFPTNDGKKHVIFFDELNRASSREVMQAVFQVLTDKRIYEHLLPEDTMIFAAINDDITKYQVLEMDPALVDRFFVQKFEPTHEDWLTYAKEKGVENEIVEFLTQRRELIDPPTQDVIAADQNNNAGLAKYPSRRSWFTFSEVMKNIKDKVQLYENIDGVQRVTNNVETLSLVREAAEGFVGFQAAGMLVEWLPLMQMKDEEIPEINIVTAEDILAGCDSSGIFSTSEGIKKVSEIISGKSVEIQNQLVLDIFNVIANDYIKNNANNGSGNNNNTFNISDNSKKAVCIFYDMIYPEIQKTLLNGASAFSTELEDYLKANIGTNVSATVASASAGKAKATNKAKAPAKKK